MYPWGDSWDRNLRNHNQHPQNRWTSPVDAFIEGRKDGRSPAVGAEVLTGAGAIEVRAPQVNDKRTGPATGPFISTYLDADDHLGQRPN